MTEYRCKAMLASASLTLTIVVACLTGCGPSQGTVSGQVLVNGNPLPTGIISFVPKADATKAQTANIVDGKYSVTVPSGESLVQISAPVVVGMIPEYNDPNAPMVEDRRESLPARYHTDSQMTHEVPSGRSTKDWELTTDGRG